MCFTLRTAELLATRNCPEMSPNRSIRISVSCLFFSSTPETLLQMGRKKPKKYGVGGVGFAFAEATFSTIIAHCKGDKSMTSFCDHELLLDSLPIV